jgi:hypothetical protein
MGPFEDEHLQRSPRCPVAELGQKLGAKEQSNDWFADYTQGPPRRHERTVVRPFRRSER